MGSSPVLTVTEEASREAQCHHGPRFPNSGQWTEADQDEGGPGLSSARRERVPGKSEARKEKEQEEIATWSLKMPLPASPL